MKENLSATQPEAVLSHVGNGSERKWLGALAQQAADGDESAFTELYRLHSGYVTRVVRRILRTEAEVEDVVQDTFLRALKGLETLSDKSAWRKWLVTIAVRSSLQLLRKRALQREELTDMPFDHLLTTDFARETLAYELYRALDSLPSELRQPWVRLRIEGLGFGSVAEELDLSLSTTKRRIGEADARLRRRLDYSPSPSIHRNMASGARSAPLVL